MQWNCPHCQTQVRVAEESVGAQWSYARCYKCTGLSMIRRPSAPSMAAPAETPVVPPRFDLERIRAAAESKANQAKITETPSSTQTLAQAMRTEGFKPRLKRKQQRLLSFAVGIAAAVAMVSGIYLFMEGRKILQKIKFAPRTSQSIQTAQSITQRFAQLEPPTSEQRPPKRPDKDTNLAGAMRVQIRAINASLRSGPGIENPVIGSAAPRSILSVIEWKDRWFRVQLPQTAQGIAGGTAWIRNDLVDPVRNEVNFLQ